VIDCLTSVSPATALTAKAAFCRFSSRRWAVTTMSCKPPCAATGAAFCAMAGVAKMADAKSILRKRIKISLNIILLGSRWHVAMHKRNILALSSS
jgi:hypothetical protein